MMMFVCANVLAIAVLVEWITQLITKKIMDF